LGRKAARVGIKTDKNGGADVAIYFATNEAQALLKKFVEKIDQEEAKGKITTWEKSDDGIYFTHTSAEWRKKAWMKPSVEGACLVFNIIKPKNANISKVVYGYYHGHLIETFLNHFDKNFTDGKATALHTSDDNCSSD
jgi:hypothetical protein